MNSSTEDEVSIKELIQLFTDSFLFLKKKWLSILLFGLMGALGGFFIAWAIPIKYTAKVSFAAEESKSMPGGLASIASQFGLDANGASGGSIFAGENLILFLKSEGLIRATLLTTFDSSKQATLADKYAEEYELKEEWAKNKKVGDVNFFKFSDYNFPRKEDSLLQSVISSVSDELKISRPEKKATIVEVEISTRNELLSKMFVERLVSTGTDRYIQTKLKFKAANVALLQKRADSLGVLLNSTTYNAAATQQNLVDINPAIRTAPVNAEISSRQKMMLATIFGEVVKNLEMAKFSLNQETPVIQIVDRSYLPLKVERKSKKIWFILGGLIAACVTIISLLVNRWWCTIISPK